MAETVPALALRRCAAYGLDYLGYAAIASAGVPVGIVLLRNNVQLSPAQLAVISSVAPAIATGWAAKRESGARHATWGKVKLGVWVDGINGSSPRFAAALVRNIAKIFVPWSLGHVLAFASPSGGWESKDPALIASAAALMVLAPVTGVSLFVGRGRAPHDWIAGTLVRSAPRS